MAILCTITSWSVRAAWKLDLYTPSFLVLERHLGQVTIEAMASGLAVLAYDYAAARQFIDHRVNGFLASPQEANSFVAAGLELIKDDVNLENLRAHARQTTLEISWGHVTKKLENNYYDLILGYHSKDQLASSPVLREIFIKQWIVFSIR